MYLGDGPDSKRVTGAEVTAEWSDDGLTVKITVDGGGEPLSVEGFDVAVNLGTRGRNEYLGLPRWGTQRLEVSASHNRGWPPRINSAASAALTVSIASNRT